jgi:molybdenum cofactor cytidylyltransferase
VSAGVVVLAAGAGRRLGGVAKALLDDGGRSFLERVAAGAAAAGVTEIVVVVGEPHREVTTAAAARLGLSVVVNPRPERGMGSSVACGFSHAQAQWRGDAALLWPVDHARVRAETVRAILAAAAGDRVVVPVWRGRGGHPVAFGRGLWPELCACATAAEGARSVVRADPARVVRVDLDDPGVIADVDTPADLDA